MLVLGMVGNILVPKYGWDFTLGLGLSLLPVVVVIFYLIGRAMPIYVAWAAGLFELYMLVPMITAPGHLYIQYGMLAWYGLMASLVLYLCGPWAYRNSSAHASP